MARVLLALVVAFLVTAPALAQVPNPSNPSPIAPSRPTAPTPPDTPQPPEPGPPDADLRPNGLTHTENDELSPTHVCAFATNFGKGNPNQYVLWQSNATPFNVHVILELNATDGWILEGENYARLDKPLLAYGETAQFCWNFTLPAGTYRATLVVDSDNEVREQSEANNVHLYQGILVKPTPMPDLIIARFVVSPRDARPGEVQAFAATVMNRGNAPSVATMLEIRDEHGLIGRLAVKPMPGGRSQAVVAITKPDLRQPGSFVAVATIDPDGNVTESSELNNVARAGYSIAPHPQPDLLLENVTINGTIEARHGFTIEGKLRNLGNASVINATIRLLVDGAPLRNVTIPTKIAPRNASAFSFFVVLSGGNHSVDLLADPDDSMAELDESNNEWTQDLGVGPAREDVQLPNLVIDRLDAGPLDPNPSEVVNITGLVRNIGLKKSNATTVTVYMGDVKLGSAKVAAVKPDVAVSFRIAWAQPIPGPYALRAVVDDDAAVNESDELDNNDTLMLEIVPPAPPAPPELPVEEPTLPNGTGTPTPPTPTVLEPNSAAPRVEIGQLEVTTRPVPGGVKGVVKVSLRNPSIEPMTRLTVSFSVDGETIRTKFVTSIDGAGTASVSSEEMDVPPGKHTLTVTVVNVGANTAPVTTSKEYDTAAGSKLFFVPDLGPIVAAVLVALALFVPRRKKR